MRVAHEKASRQATDGIPVSNEKPRLPDKEAGPNYLRRGVVVDLGEVRRLRCAPVRRPASPGERAG